MGLLDSIKGFFGFGSVGQKRQRSDDAEPQPSAKRPRAETDDDDEVWEQGIEDEYDPTVLSDEDANTLQRLGVTPFKVLLERTSASSAEKREIWETMMSDDADVLRALLKKLKLEHTAKMSLEELRGLLDDEYEKALEKAPPSSEEISIGDLVEVQDDWASSIAANVDPMPKHIFKSPYGLVRTSTGKQSKRVAVSQEASCRDNDGKWLQQKGTIKDLLDMEAIAEEFHPTPDPTSEYKGDRWHLPGGDGDGTLIPMMAPLAAAHSNVTQKIFAKMTDRQRKKVLGDSLGVGLHLQEFLSENGMELSVWDDMAEQAVQETENWEKLYETDEMDEAIWKKQEEWGAQLEVATEPLGMLHHLACSESGIVVLPYFAFGVTKNGNCAGYFSVRVHT